MPLPDAYLKVYSPLKGGYPKQWENYVSEKYSEFMVTPVEVAKDSDRYIISFSFFDIKHLLDVNPKGGAYVYSSSEAFTEEQKIDFWRLSNWISYLRMHVHGFEPVTSPGADPVFHKGFHASGHMPEEQLREMIFAIEPEMLVPVHTVRPDWFVRVFGGAMRVQVLESYRPVSL